MLSLELIQPNTLPALSWGHLETFVCAAQEEAFVAITKPFEALAGHSRIKAPNVIRLPFGCFGRIRAARAY